MISSPFLGDRAQVRADRQVVLAAVRQHWAALRFASPELRADQTVCLAAVGQSGLALRHADPRLLQVQPPSPLLSTETARSSTQWGRGSVRPEE